MSEFMTKNVSGLLVSDDKSLDSLTMFPLMEFWHARCEFCWRGAIIAPALKLSRSGEGKNATLFETVIHANRCGTRCLDAARLCWNQSKRRSNFYPADRKRSGRRRPKSDHRYLRIRARP